MTVENTTDRPIRFVLEPWANEHEMAPGERFVVEAVGPAKDAELWLMPPEQDGYLVVWAWAGARARVLREDGSVVEDW
jgi:hypothetical protein